MKSELDKAFSRLKDPRMSASLTMLHSLLHSLKGDPESPGTVKDRVAKMAGQRDISKQSITNVARRLEELNFIERKEGYSVNYGYLISVLLDTVIHLNESLKDLEDEVASLKSLMKPTS